ncbi:MULTISPECIES: MarR family transcriptional regulator [Nocardia]|uniref:MarR family transcriptional regulator n=1 Tax=Nocardia TaxID=1817 RepID=UPI0007EB6AB8|nr:MULTISPECIES: MarR family transcriptional regulator [Nocardia]MBF6275346.1 MarR family transcriptional regulator [Nocardia nova]OBA53868.1 MarR family transcriptional regulator [Nocardia sp. 852002-51101_SCH5132738]OBB53453.1 MarR family transcriptional regulator [Nocardia sp. 852002-51244_SCH5132740]OBF78672.1 MarR family transcriptional regulator [Mycobacterium sp. 852002-51759_SCH5129042]
MSTEHDGLSLDESVRAMVLLMPRLVGRAKRLPVPDALRSFDLAPRHLSLLTYVLFDGPLTVNELARRLEVAPTTVSLMIADLSRQGVLERRTDDNDRRRTLVTIAGAHRKAVADWLGGADRGWRAALGPLTAEQRALVIATLRAYEEAVSAG